MNLDRRAFLAGAGALALSTRPAIAAWQSARTAGVFPVTVRLQFPGASVETYLNAAAIHPLGTFAADAIEQTVAYRMRGPGPGRSDFGVNQQNDLKVRFGRMIGA